MKYPITITISVSDFMSDFKPGPLGLVFKGFESYKVIASDKRTVTVTPTPVPYNTEVAN